MSHQFDQLLTASLPRLRIWALGYTRNKADADDLVQSTAVLALRFQSGFAMGTNFSAWIHRIMRNRFFDICKSNARNPTSMEDAPERALGHNGGVYEHILAREVVGTINKLSPLLREVLTLICSAEFSYQEAATALACSVGTIKSRMWRARLKLHALLGAAVLNGTASNIPHVY